MKIFVNDNKTVWKIYTKAEDIVLATDRHKTILQMSVITRWKGQTQKMINKGEVTLGNHLVSNEEVHNLIDLIWTVDEVRKTR